MLNYHQKMDFKNGDFKNHILNEKNKFITENFINNIFKTYNFSHRVQNLQNYQIAMTHVSYLNKTFLKEKTAKILLDIPPISELDKRNAIPLQQIDYNTFEYYGDSVIHLILTQYLYDRYPSKDTGFLTKLRTKIERAETLSFLSKQLKLHEYVVIGRNMEINNSRENDVHLTEDIFEAFIWAVFLETNFLLCKKLLISILERELDFAEIIKKDENYKEQIMQYFHKMKLQDPKYIENIQHRKTAVNCHYQEFVINLVEQENGRIIGVGTGNTKIKAEQNAAQNAMEIINKTNGTNINVNNIEIEILLEYKIENIRENINIFCNINEENLELQKKQEEEWKTWFLDGDHRNHMLNEKNKQITQELVNNILSKYGLKNIKTNIINFQKAMTHVSYLNKIALKEKTAILLKDIPSIEKCHIKKTISLQEEDNSRLAHLGNAILRLALTEYLSQRYTSKYQDQGFLTKLRTKIERAENLSELTCKFGLDKYALIARNMEINNSRVEDVGLLKSLFEAFIGALSLIISYEDCKLFIIKILESEVDFSELLQRDDNYKEKLMQYFHKMKWREALYVEKKNNDEISEGKEREYIIAVLNNDGKVIGIGKGNTKNKAEQLAAREALAQINKMENPININNDDYYGEMSDSDSICEEYI